MPTRLLLFSPAIGVSDFAVMTNFASLLAFVPGLERARWLDVVVMQRELGVGAATAPAERHP